MFSWLENYLLPCALKSTAGIDCPLCGGQRSFLLLLNGNFAESFSIYPPLLFVLSYILILALYLLKRRYVSRKKLDIAGIAVLCIIFINYGFKIITGDIHS